MMLELTVEEAAALRDLLRQRVTELDREINRTDRRKHAGAMGRFMK